VYFRDHGYHGDDHAHCDYGDHGVYLPQQMHLQIALVLNNFEPAIK
ncbi:MAG: hypothetical protein F6K38_30055, partial [Moorea sp. SIO3B2]|nr:hypothetical protein [Moorena sp. SIO3B2]